MRVNELMSAAKCCREGASVRECARLMKEESIGFIPICNAKGEPVGAITDRDLAIRVLAEGHSADDRIDRFATSELVTCRLDSDVNEAERLMREHRKSRVMVCDDQGKLRGVVSLADIADAESDASVGRILSEVKSDQPTAH